MRHPTPSELREMLVLMREFGVPEETLQSVLMNAARRFGIGAPVLRNESVAEFIEQWKNEEIPLPLIACMSSDLHAAYQVWACQNRKARIDEPRQFGKDISALGIHTFRTNEGTVVDPTGEVDSILKEAVKRFRKALEAYQKKLKGSSK